MRLKANLWVKAYLRRCAGAGVPAVVVRHGDDDAGAIFIRVNRLDGTSLLFGPSPAGLSGAESDRSWVACFPPAGVEDERVDAHLGREANFDSDLWIVEIESPTGAHFLDAWLLDEKG